MKILRGVMVLLVCASAVIVAACCGIGPASRGKVAEWEGAKRAEVLKWFSENQFGVTPIGRPDDQKIGERSVTFADGKITINIKLMLPEGASKDHPVPVFLFGDHTCEGKAPFAKTTYAHFDPSVITSRGYAYVTWNMNDVCPNAARYTKNLETWADGVIAWAANKAPASRDVKRTQTSWGTIGAWAWGHSRVMDWIETRGELDAKRVAVFGHSRGGKTALWAGAQDTRFAMVISNNSGCGGAKLNNFNCEKSEHISQILHNFPNWFCLNYQRWIGRDKEIECDSDDLLRLVAPRLLCVGSADEDQWAGPFAERESWLRSHDIWEAYGCTDRMHYHIRPGKHKLTNYDLSKYLDFADKHWR